MDWLDRIAQYRRVKQLSSIVLQRCCAATAAQGVRRIEPLQRLWSGYGEIVRLWLHDGSCESVVVKLVQPAAAAKRFGQEAQRSHARKLRSYAVELCFYTRYAPRCDERCRVAQALLCEQLDDGEHHWLFVLEDLDAAGFSERRSQLPRHALEACMSWLAHFHATYMAAPPEGLWNVGTYWHLDTRPDELARSVDPELREAAAWLDGRLNDARYRTIVHGDAKVENFCFTRDLQRVAAVDFQYAGAGCGVQDVAYFLSSCLGTHAAEAQAAAQLDHYFKALQQVLATKHPSIDAEALEAEWRELYPIAWADFARFMSGWAPEHHTRSGYAGHMTASALAAHAESRAIEPSSHRPRPSSRR